jgi:flavin-dependent dehydrogenase
VSAEIGASVLGRALFEDDLGEDRLRAYQEGWRKRLGPELDSQLSLRRLAYALTDDDIEALFQLARTDGIMPIVRRTARFNQHRHLIFELLKHPPVRRVLMSRIF